MKLRFPISEAQTWAIGAAVAIAAHGFGFAALIGGQGRTMHASAAIPIEVQLGAETEMITQQSDVAPGERQHEAARPQPQEMTPTPQAPRAPHGELAMAEPQQRTPDAPPSEQAPAPETTAPQMTASHATRSHPRTASFEQILSAHLERNKRYPRAARAHHQEGVVLVQFQMDRQGRVLSSRLAHSSGHDLLDEEVMALLQRAQPLPPPPHTIAGAVIDLTVPVEFHLR